MNIINLEDVYFKECDYELIPSLSKIHNQISQLNGVGEEIFTGFISTPEGILLPQWYGNTDVVGNHLDGLRLSYYNDLEDEYKNMPWGQVW